MTKAQDIKAFQTFIKAVSKDGAGGTYFEQLVINDDLIYGNISNDLDAFMGIFRHEVEVKANEEKLESVIRNLQAEVSRLEAEAEKYDVRILRQRKNNAEVTASQLQEEIENLQAALTEQETVISEISKMIQDSARPEDTE